jgi:hypothetical protein
MGKDRTGYTGYLDLIFFSQIGVIVKSRFNRIMISNDVGACPGIKKSDKEIRLRIGSAGRIAGVEL